MAEFDFQWAKTLGYIFIFIYVCERTILQWQLWTLGGGKLMTPWSFYRRQCEAYEILESWWDV